MKYTLIGIAIGIVIMLLYNWQCNKPITINPTKTDSSEHATYLKSVDQHLRDSANLMYVLYVNDSLNRENARLEVAKNNARMQLESVGRDKIIINDKYKAAKARADVAEQLVNCDELSKGYDTLVDNYIVLKEKDDSLEHKLDAQILFDASEIAKAYISLDTCHANNVNLDRLYKQKVVEDILAIKAAAKSKRWGIGPNVGIGYSDKIRPFIGISVQYNLIKF